MKKVCVSVCVCVCARVCVHMLRDACHPDPDNFANEDSLPDNEDIALLSMQSRGEQVTTKDAASNSNTVAAAALGGDLQLTPQRGHRRWRSPW